MRTICFFASYFNSKDLPYYIEVYLMELKKQYSEVVLFTSQMTLNQSSLDFLEDEQIDLRMEENRGFDFGMWYKAFQTFDVSKYDQIALVNDSCVLFKSLNSFSKWAANNEADLKGITFSEAVSPHIQSYYLLLSKKAIPFVADYFKQNKLLTNIKEVIRVYEIGLSSFLLSKGLTIAAYMDNDGYKGEFSPYYQCIEHHLKQGIPLIKKKILFSSYRKDELFTLARMNFNIVPDFYIQKIKESEKNLLIDFSKLKKSTQSELTGFERFKYELNRIIVKLVRSFK